ncbi:peptide chain release factor N(5)-glutamine methyltransferase [Paracoccus sp. Z118]|uniref:peptide chain release factor N(5)-glutamine methyltransferase n=1 Tax=Paracoccus sp. Z118 TaxID=2851017 RepID=UPI001C2B7F39|nr:peptide chain release factor N(5)-glutamine methyltransferase [Paracoccus sp. Z118]
MSVTALLNAAAARLASAGIPDPQADARRLVAFALDVPPERLRLGETTPTEAQLAALDAALAARAARQPVSQIVGWRDFWKQRFRVTRDTLDPRPETETLVAAALELPWRTVLDLGTGTGAILLSLLADRPGANGVGTDISEAALTVARDNAARLGVEAAFLRSDWFAQVDGRFDLIVSNPPYIAAEEMAALLPDVREWEPRGALTDEGDGLAAYRAITAGAGAHLTPGGWLLVEIGWAQGAAVAALMGAAGFGEIRVLPDLDGRDRVVAGQVSAL